MAVSLQRRGNDAAGGRSVLSIATVWLLAVVGLLLSSTSGCGDRTVVEAFSVFSPTYGAPNTRFGAPTSSSSSSVTLQQALSLRKGPSSSSSSSMRRRKTVLYRIRCENKYYQLEEMEDRENSTTELFLKEDGQILIGETDGPLWTEAVGTWKIRPGTDDFTMNIKRKFQSGNDGSDMGEFEYELERTYIGDMTAVGESVAVTGVMHCTDVLSGEDQEVGFFNMIDGTDAREDKRSDAQPGTGVAGKQVKDAAESHKGADWVSSYNQQSSTSSYGGDSYAQPAQTGYDNGYQQQQYETSYGSFAGSGQAQQQGSNDPGPPSFADYAYGGQQQQQPQQQQEPSYQSEYDRQSQAQYQQQDQQQQQDPSQQGGYGEGWSNENDMQSYQDNWPRY
eukprot:CAMPEP_0113484276 /NCGR_PEP_ID=MMETSP0014_2-20120614/23877_1 /TAXON_ID=2857 /ORGANISM="Nitzschia sp." /LENGTH=391 /DNA_ID=CAMNT_0000377871 /DNA_START=142 /DNA_END=1317 /DNA_ORIENTATION=+ /assembly_acc=CAM_ASM_000159